MKHYFDENGIEFQTPPDPFHGRSPMHNSDGTMILSSGCQLDYSGENVPNPGVPFILATTLTIENDCSVVLVDGTTVGLTAGNYTKLNRDGTTA